MVSPVYSGCTHPDHPRRPPHLSSPCCCRRRHRPPSSLESDLLGGGMRRTARRHPPSRSERRRCFPDSGHCRGALSIYDRKEPCLPTDMESQSDIGCSHACHGGHVLSCLGQGEHKARLHEFVVWNGCHLKPDDAAAERRPRGFCVAISSVFLTHINIPFLSTEENRLTRSSDRPQRPKPCLKTYRAWRGSYPQWLGRARLNCRPQVL